MTESIKNVAAALLSAQREMGMATKGASNPFFKSKFADLNAIREVTIPVLNKYGITVLQPTTSIGGKSFVQTMLLHESGEYLSSLTEVVCAKANDPQAHGSGLSYARRYGLQAFLCVGAADDDAESAMTRESKSSTTTINVNGNAAASVAAESTSPARRPSFRKQVATSTQLNGGDDL